MKTVISRCLWVYLSVLSPQHANQLKLRFTHSFCGVCVCVFQRSFPAEVMASSAENGSIVHLDAPILPDKSDVSNMTIIRTGTGAIIEDEFFLNTVLARVVSGVFVWAALFITCHQVSLPHGLQTRRFGKSPIPGKLKSLQHQAVLSSGASKLRPGSAVVPL